MVGLGTTCALFFFGGCLGEGHDGRRTNKHEVYNEAVTELLALTSADTHIRELKIQDSRFRRLSVGSEAALRDTDMETLTSRQSS